MRVFFKILFVFIYFCLSFFINTTEVQACNSLVLNTQTLNYISQPKSELTFAKKHEETYLVSNNQNRYEITNTSNKNYKLGFSLGDKPLLEEYILNNFILGKVNISANRIAHNISPNLKNAIYTRAP